MRLTQFWARMTEAFGHPAAETFAHDHVLSALGNRTVNEALAGGVPAKTVWAAVCEAMELPPQLR